MVGIGFNFHNLAFSFFKKGGLVMTQQLHKRFSDEQVKLLINKLELNVFGAPIRKKVQLRTIP
jgi:hypothetical protein